MGFVFRFLVLCVYFLDRILSSFPFSFGYCGNCQFFDLWILMTPLVSSNSSKTKRLNMNFWILVLNATFSNKIKYDIYLVIKWKTKNTTLSEQLQKPKIPHYRNSSKNQKYHTIGTAPKTKNATLSDSEKIGKIQKKSKLNTEMIRKIWKKGKSNSEIIGKTWKKCKLNSEKIWKIQKIQKTIRNYPTQNRCIVNDNKKLRGKKVREKKVRGKKSGKPGCACEQPLRVTSGSHGTYTTVLLL